MAYDDLVVLLGQRPRLRRRVRGGTVRAACGIAAHEGGGATRAAHSSKARAVQDAQTAGSSRV